jgi:hypothetical protein
MFKLLAREAGLVGGPLGGLISQFGLLSVGSSRLGVGITAGTIAIAAIGAAIVKNLGAYSEFEQRQTRSAAALVLTNQASGQTAQGLEVMARALAESGTVSLDSIREAQSELLKFKTVGGDAFQSVLEVAKRVSRGGFVDVKTATKAVGDAFKDVASAQDILGAAGIKLDTAVAKQARDLKDQGDQFGAQRVILDALLKNTQDLSDKGVDTLSASLGRLKNAGGDTFEAFGEWVTKGLGLKNVIDGITESTKKNIEEQRKSSGLLSGVAPPRRNE